MHSRARILILDDEPANVRLLERILQVAGYTNLASTTDSRQAMTLFQQFHPDMILTDLLMPHLDGFAVMEKMKEAVDPQTFLPIIVLTADINPDVRRRALAAGASDFLTKPFDHGEVVLRIANLLRTRLLHEQLQAQNATLEQKVQERTALLQEALDELQNTQKQVVQQERLSALGLMAGGIAHDFNNALASILGYSELVMRDAEALSPKISGYLEVIATAAKDCTRMVDRLREFSRPCAAQETRQAINLNELIEQSISLTLPKWKTQALASGLTISIETELKNPARILGDPAELREVLTNLIFNAVDALPEGGTISICTSSTAERVRLEVRDTGIGMSDEVRERCLEPFFTTKGTRGTGLGLAMVWGIIQRHGGTIEIQSAPGKGAAFIFELPVCTSEPGSTAAGAQKLDRPLHILVVDDQPVLCELLNEYLSNDWHTVETAANGREALEKFRIRSFDLVITDKAMPEMDGEQLAVAIKQLKPQQAVVLLTGFGDLAAPDGKRPAGIDLVLGKPVSLQTLRQALLDVMVNRKGA